MQISTKDKETLTEFMIRRVEGGSFEIHRFPSTCIRLIFLGLILTSTTSLQITITQIWYISIITNIIGHLIIWIGVTAIFYNIWQYVKGYCNLYNSIVIKEGILDYFTNDHKKDIIKETHSDI